MSSEASKAYTKTEPWRWHGVASGGTQKSSVKKRKIARSVVGPREKMLGATERWMEKALEILYIYAFLLKATLLNHRVVCFNGSAVIYGSESTAKVSNMFIIAAVWLGQHLHTPMYYFLCSLAFLDICYSIHIFTLVPDVV
ncbi:olfactory receptor 14A16-like, partial [Pelobates cultripes]